MERPRAVILTEGGREYGFGHVTRCLAMYQAFEKLGAGPTLLVRGDESVKGLLKGTRYRFTEWLGNTESTLRSVEGADIAVVDSYTADEDFYRRLSRIAKVPVYIDDYRRVDYPRGVVVNGNAHGELTDYPVKEGTLYLLGTRYLPLRRCFWDVPPRDTAPQVRRVLVTFGGSDVRGMTPRMVDMLERLFPDLEKVVVVGRGSVSGVRHGSIRFVHCSECEAMRDLMLRSDLALSAGGQTLYELARTGLPTVAVITEDNQVLNVKGLKEKGFLEEALLWDDPDLMDRVAELLRRFVSSEDLRREKSRVGREIVDGKGALRLARTLLEVLDEGLP